MLSSTALLAGGSWACSPFRRAPRRGWNSPFFPCRWLLPHRRSRLMSPCRGMPLHGQALARLREVRISRRASRCSPHSLATPAPLRSSGREVRCPCSEYFPRWRSGRQPARGTPRCVRTTRKAARSGAVMRTAPFARKVPTYRLPRQTVALPWLPRSQDWSRGRRSSPGTSAARSSGSPYSDGHPMSPSSRADHGGSDWAHQPREAQ